MMRVIIYADAGWGGLYLMRVIICADAGGADPIYI